MDAPWSARKPGHPFLGNGFERPDVIEMPVRQYDRAWAAGATKTRLRRRTEVRGCPRHSGIDECPISVSGSGRSPEDYVDDSNEGRRGPKPSGESCHRATRHTLDGRRRRRRTTVSVSWLP